MLFGCWFTVNTISQLWLCSWWPKPPTPSHTPHPPYPPPPSRSYPSWTHRLPTFNREANLVCPPPSYVPPTFFYRHNERLALFLTGRHSAIIHSHVVRHLLSPLWCMLFHGAQQGRLVLIRPPLQREKQTPKWAPGVCPCPLPGRFSLWCILALGNIDLNALCFDLNQLLPVYLYR